MAERQIQCFTLWSSNVSGEYVLCSDITPMLTRSPNAECRILFLLPAETVIWKISGIISGEIFCDPLRLVNDYAVEYYLSVLEMAGRKLSETHWNHCFNNLQHFVKEILIARSKLSAIPLHYALINNWRLLFSLY